MESSRLRDSVQEGGFYLLEGGLGGGILTSNGLSEKGVRIQLIIWTERGGGRELDKLAGFGDLQKTCRNVMTTQPPKSKASKLSNLLILLAGGTGIEPATYAL